MRAMMVVLVFVAIVAGCADVEPICEKCSCSEAISDMSRLCAPLAAPVPRCKPGEEISIDEYECLMHAVASASCKVSSTDVAICHSLSK